jgi:hypothetical protein
MIEYLCRLEFKCEKDQGVVVQVNTLQTFGLTIGEPCHASFMILVVELSGNAKSFRLSVN